MFARIAHELRRRVKPHRLGIKKRGKKDVRMPAFHPGRGIGNERERGGVGFRKSVRAKTFELSKGSCGKILRITARDHAGDQLLLEAADATGVFKSRHGAAQLVGLAGRKARASDRNAHRLLLEERHAQRLAEHFFEFWRGIVYGLLAFAPA